MRLLIIFLVIYITLGLFANYYLPISYHPCPPCTTDACVVACNSFPQTPPDGFITINFWQNVFMWPAKIIIYFSTFLTARVG